MQNPKIHSGIDKFIPENHWLMKSWLDHADPTKDDDPGTIVCETCGRHIYSFSEGTLEPWIETGRIVDRHGHQEPETPCVSCFATRGRCIPDIHPMYALTDEGGPQPYDEN